MTNDSLLRLHLPGLLLILALLIALAFFLIFAPERVARTLFFPGTTTTELSGERRLIPRVREEERALELLVEELLLGPARISHSRLLPREARTRSVILRDDVLYVDLNAAAMLEHEEVHVDITTGLDAIRETILYNFRWLEEVILTIDRNVPFAPAYRDIGSQAGSVEE